MGVTGIGGFLFRARDPDGLRDWYRVRLGVGGEGWTPWEQAAGPTLFLPVAAQSDAVPPGRAWSLTLRVEGLDALLAALDALLAALGAAGVSVTTNPDWDSPETGRFARLHDPEGNSIELWEPAAE